MTPVGLRKEFERLEREAQGKDRHQFMPTCIQHGLKEDGSVEWAEIRSDMGTLWKYPAGHRSRATAGVRATYQAWQVKPSKDARGDQGWRFDEASLQ
jgi:hypothetical protein